MPTARRPSRRVALLAVILASLSLGAPGATATGPAARVGPIVGGLTPVGGRWAPALHEETAAIDAARSDRRIATPSAVTTHRTTAAATRPSRPTPPRARATAPRQAVVGRNHVWMPALGIDRSVSFFSCSSSAYPGNRVYRWGCAGSNNVYLFGHAYGVFRSLHDAYVRGRLHRGMTLYYANAAGHVSRYVVSWWRVTTPDKGAFAYAAQPRPSVTLQTCLGSRSQYRLIVRLTRAG